MEARSLSPALSNQLLSKVREYKADLAKLQQEVRHNPCIYLTSWTVI